MRIACCAAALLAAFTLVAAERKLDFAEIPESRFPELFRSAVMGEGGPGQWQILQDEVPPMLAPLSPRAPVVTRRAVLAQMSQNSADERFPMLILKDQVFSDFKLSTRFKLVKGKVEQMAGIAFRVQDETNYYVVRASGIGNTFRFYKVVNGIRGNIIGPEVPIPAGEWHTLGVECQGNQIRCSLNGKELIPPLTDNTFTRGRIAFWTKSDSVSYFADTQITFKPTENPAQGLVRSALAEYSRLLGLEVYLLNDSGTPVLIGSHDEKDLGAKGGSLEVDVIQNSTTYYKKDANKVAVTLPLRDKNGDTIAAVRVTMRSFPGQTEQNAIVRAMPVVKKIQNRVQNRTDLAE